MSDLVIQCLNLPLGQKRRLCDLLIKSCHEDAMRESAWRAGRGKKLVDIACELLDFENGLPNGRCKRATLARTMIAYQMYLEGFSETYTGEIINRNHSTIHKLKENMKDIFIMPTFYTNELAVWNEFKKRIENEIDTDTI